LFEVFPITERTQLIEQMCSAPAADQPVTQKQPVDDFWTIQEQGWLVSSYFSTTFRGPMQQVENRFEKEIVSRLSMLDPVHETVKEDMEYVTRQWRMMLDASVNAWCANFRSQHRQLKGAGPGDNNWWWIPVSEEDTWYQKLIESETA
jgi:hypothetical protein